MLTPRPSQQNAAKLKKLNLGQQCPESPKISRRQYCWLFCQLILTFTTVLLVAESLARILVVIGNPPESHLIQYDRKMELAKKFSPSSSPFIVLLGSSHTATALIPELMIQEFDIRQLSVDVLNLGVSASTPNISLTLLKQAIKKGKRPNLVIHDIAPPWMFNKSYYDSELSSHSKFKASYAGQCLSNMSQLSQQQQFKCYTQRRLHLARHQSYLKSLLQKVPDLMLRPHSNTRFQNLAEPAIESSPKGWFPIYEFHTSAMLEKRLGRVAGTNTLNANDDLRLLYGHFEWDDRPMQQLISYCQKENIPLILLWTPEHPVRQQYNHMFGLDNKLFEEHFRRYDQLEGLSVWDFHETPYPQRYYQNTDHLNVEGAVHFTRLLTNQIINNMDPSNPFLTSKHDYQISSKPGGKI